MGAENLYNMSGTNLARISDDFYVSRPWGRACLLLCLAQHACTAVSACAVLPMPTAPQHESRATAPPAPAAPQPRLFHHPHLDVRLQLAVCRGAGHS